MELIKRKIDNETTELIKKCKNKQIDIDNAIIDFNNGFETEHSFKSRVLNILLNTM